MKIQKIIFALAFVSFLAVGCKTEAKKEEATKEQKTEMAANAKELSLNISGMTCEIGCAKKIASDLSKKEGVLKANVVFNDSIATIKYDANITNKADLIAFVEGIGSGEMYKASETTKKACKEGCTMACCAKKDAAKKACKADCKKECCTKSEADKKACATDCKKQCCAETKKA
ncbi:cation transporter [Tenacibaculum insulae]|uniref:cation transporter n=1 Tax=Tenacibaculum insulae TaxID=2029677 RepID=UPI003AB48321